MMIFSFHLLIEGGLMNINKLYKYILSLSSEDRIKYLTNDYIRTLFLTDKAHYPFIWLVQGLEGVELKYFIDSDYLNKILSNSKSIDKINAIMTSCNSYNTDVLLDDKAISLILDSSSKLSTYLYNLDYRMGVKIIDYDIKYNTDHFNMLSCFDVNKQLQIFNTDTIIKLLKYKELPSRFLVELEGRVVAKLIRIDKFLNMFLNLTINDIDNIIKNNLVIPKYLYNNKLLIDKYIKIDTNRYRDYVNDLIKNNYEFYIIVERNRLNYIDNKIHNIKNQVFSEYQDFNKDRFFDRYDYKTAYNLQYIKDDKNKVYEYFKYRTKEQLVEMIIDVLFKDIPYNFLINLKAILNYSKENPKYITKNIDLYNTILNFDNLDILNIIKFFNDNKDKRLDQDFYDDFRIARNTSYKQMNESIIKLDKSSQLYKEDKSIKLGVDIYELNGESFYLYVHSSNKGRWNNCGITTSISLISNDNISTINDYDTIFGFAKLNINNIMHMYHSDSFSSHMLGTHKIHDINNPDKLIEKTTSYNEILYKDDEEFKPDYIVCFDSIKGRDIKLSKEMNIPIIVINSNKYFKKRYGLESLSENNYLNGREVTNYDVLKDIKKK